MGRRGVDRDGQYRDEFLVSTLNSALSPSSTPVTIDAKLSSRRIMSAACLDTSEPAIPMATPMSAFFKAGESFTPSPVTATIAPCQKKGGGSVRATRSRGLGVEAPQAHALTCLSSLQTLPLPFLGDSQQAQTRLSQKPPSHYPSTELRSDDKHSPSPY